MVCTTITASRVGLNRSSPAAPHRRTLATASSTLPARNSLGSFAIDDDAFVTMPSPASLRERKRGMATAAERVLRVSRSDEYGVGEVADEVKRSLPGDVLQKWENAASPQARQGEKRVATFFIFYFFRLDIA